MNATMQSLVTNNTINTYMRNIRKKFEKLDAEFSWPANMALVIAGHSSQSTVRLI